MSQVVGKGSSPSDSAPVSSTIDYKKEQTLAEQEAEILFPERVLTIQDEPITVKEINFIQGMRLAPQVDAITADMAELFSHGDCDINELMALFAQHEKAFLDIMAVSVDKPAEWFDGLSDADGQALMMTFWTVNTGFFTRRVAAIRLAAGLREADENKKPNEAKTTLEA